MHSVFLVVVLQERGLSPTRDFKGRGSEPSPVMWVLGDVLLDLIKRLWVGSRHNGGIHSLAKISIHSLMLLSVLAPRSKTDDDIQSVVHIPLRVVITAYYHEEENFPPTKFSLVAIWNHVPFIFSLFSTQLLSLPWTAGDYCSLDIVRSIQDASDSPTHVSGSFTGQFYPCCKSHSCHCHAGPGICESLLKVNRGFSSNDACIDW